MQIGKEWSDVCRVASAAAKTFPSSLRRARPRKHRRAVCCQANHSKGYPRSTGHSKSEVGHSLAAAHLNWRATASQHRAQRVCVPDVGGVAPFRSAATCIPLAAKLAAQKLDPKSQRQYLLNCEKLLSASQHLHLTASASGRNTAPCNARRLEVACYVSKCGPGRSSASTNSQGHGQETSREKWSLRVAPERDLTRDDLVGLVGEFI